MVLYTAKDAFADRDPRRNRMTPPKSLAGWIEADGAALRRAYAYLEARHAAPCSLGHTPLVVQRLPVLGVANDINYVVRSFASALRQDAQLLLLPPLKARKEWMPLVADRDIDGNAWHWLDGSPGASLSTIFVPSSCQLLLQQPAHRERLRMFDRLTRNHSIRNVSVQLGLGTKVFDNEKTYTLVRGVKLSTVPGEFRGHGMLWWWQALTSYLVRVRGVLAERVSNHPAITRLMHRLAVSTDRAPGEQTAWLAESRAALRWAVKGGGDSGRVDGSGNTSGDELGWLPDVAFDAALHVRQGDACGPEARKHQEVVRKCVHSFAAGLAPLLAHGVVPNGGRLFLATDSQRIVDEAAEAAKTLPFGVYFLPLHRAKYDSATWIELASAQAGSQARILEEALLDVLLLSRARFIAGSMFGNVPRLALQMRATTPGDKHRLTYVTTDGRDWCTRTTCIKNNTITGMYW